VNRSIDMGIVDKYSRAIAVLLGNHDFIELDGPFIALVKMCEFDPANVRLAVFRRVEEERVIMQVHDAKHPRTIRLEKVAAAVPAVELDRTDLPFDINQETVPLRVNQETIGTRKRGADTEPGWLDRFGDELARPVRCQVQADDTVREVLIQYPKFPIVYQNRGGAFQIDVPGRVVVITDTRACSTGAAASRWKWTSQDRVIISNAAI